MRYMIATALIVVGAGVVRTLLLIFKLEIQTIFNLSTAITFLLFILFIIFDRVKGKTVAGNPMTIAFLILLVPSVLSYIVPQTSWCQNFADVIVSHLL